MENHHFQRVNQLFLWPFSLAMLNYQRVYGDIMGYLSSHILGLGLSYGVIWRFPKMEVPQWLDGSVKPINVDDLGVPPF